jgi:Tetratricopeptide repeat
MVDHVPGDSARKRTSRRALLSSVLLVAAPALAGPRLTFMRVASSAYTVPAGQRIAVIYAIGDHEAISTFVDDFVDDVDRAGTLRIENAVGSTDLASFDGHDFRRLRKEHPADKYLGVSAFRCNGKQHNAVGSERDAVGDRVQRMHVWVDAACEARIDMRDDRGQHLMTINVRGEGTSPRGSSLTEEERRVAFDQAARYAAFNAADMITPRMVRETIELDETAPAFDDAMPMIDGDRLEDARALWETALKTNRGSAALHFNLAAISEALGDRAAAKKYFQAAVRLAPDNSRYRAEMRRAGERRP